MSVKDSSTARPEIRGKSLYCENEKIWVRGVTYGTFRPGADGTGYDRALAKRDFARMAENGFNAVRTYTVPPEWLLDLAAMSGLRVMVGLPWEQHVAFMDDRKLTKRIEDVVISGVRASAAHPAILCYAIGNEIPTSIVRWHGHARVEKFLRRLFDAAKTVDPQGLFTYVNYPSTEYIDLSFLDLLCCNVYLESQERLEAYLARLQNIAGDRPLLLGEIGFDSRRNSEETQARVLDWQIQTALGGGCAGAFIFAWTDEWHRGDFDVDDWDFGLTRRDRAPKPALAAVSKSFALGPFAGRTDWPSVSVVVCSYNGSSTIADCLEGLTQLDYPNFEVIVVNDGSTDRTGEIAAGYGFRVIATENRGLASARNTGMDAARGKIIAYIDDDARPDPHWLYYLASTFLRTGHVGVGGPNITPIGDGDTANCVANAPGGPMHVLIGDTEAEHIPGCNMAFRLAALKDVGGFDPQFRAAGDDVDLCWRLQERGWTLGFNPGAVVLHHRRKSIRAYWKQQAGYGKAEAMLERKWPEKYNGFGHLTWAGRLYGKGRVYSKGLMRFLLGSRGRIYQGTWGSAAFQSVDELKPGTLSHLPLMPEWFLLLALLGVLSALGAFWKPLLAAAPVLLIAVVLTLMHAWTGGTHAVFPGPRRRRSERIKLHALTSFLHLLQPLSRLIGRLRHGLTPWRQRGAAGFLTPIPRKAALWTEQWHSLHTRLHSVEQCIKDEGLSVLRGGPYDRWDIEVWSGPLSGSRALFAIEEHGAGQQLVRLKSWPIISMPSVALGILLSALCGAAAADGSLGVSLILGLSVLIFAGRVLWEGGVAAAALHQALELHESHRAAEARDPLVAAATKAAKLYIPDSRGDLTGIRKLS